MAQEHLLGELRLPDRYEQLRRDLGPDLLRVLVGPPKATETDLKAVAQAILSKGRGLLVPVFADSGTGKSTLAHSLGHFLPEFYVEAEPYVGAISDGSLADVAAEVGRRSKADERRVVPLVVDGREGDPPTEAELAAIKRFTRADGVGSRTALFWLETDGYRSSKMADGYERLAGRPPVTLPLEAAGPVHTTWPSVAVETLQLANDVGSLESLGVDPHAYDPKEFHTLGDFLSRVADDFNAMTRKMLAELDKPTQLAVLFASESRDPGPLAQFTEGRRLGLLNAHALVGATPGTEEGRWWGERVGLLTSTIVRLNARAYVLPPTVTVTALRRHGEQAIRDMLKDEGIGDTDPAPYWERSEVGRFLRGEERDTAEARGNPSEKKKDAFALMAGAGFLSGGRDKTLNAGLSRSLEAILPNLDSYDNVAVETRLPTAHQGGGELIPDIWVEGGGIRTCLEVAWRRGEYTVTGKRADMAAYILRKLRAYARALGWTAD
jgi:hypothetical protein